MTTDDSEKMKLVQAQKGTRCSACGYGYTGSKEEHNLTHVTPTEDSVEKLVEEIYRIGSSVGKTETDIRHEIAELLTTFKDQCVREERESTVSK